MKKLIFAIMAVVCSMNASETNKALIPIIQEIMCFNKESLSFYIDDIGDTGEILCFIDNNGAQKIADNFHKTICGKRSYSCIEYYDEQCNAKNYGACQLVGILYVEQGKFYKFTKYFEKICNDANSKSTFQVKLIDGSLGPKIPAVTAMKEVCYLSAAIYEADKVVEKDRSKALKYYNKGCDLGDNNACSSAAFYYSTNRYVKKDINRAIKLYDKACNLGSWYGCEYLQEHYGDTPKGVEYRKKACNFGYGFACLQVGQYYENKKNLSKAKQWFKKSCEVGCIGCCDSYKKLLNKGVR